MRPAPWNTEENQAIVALYFRMLDGINRVGEKLNKAALIRVAQHGIGPRDLSHANITSVDGFINKLEARSRGSIEAKLMNCSAAHRDLNPEAETMATHGYKAWGNYQSSLKDEMLLALQNRVLTSEQGVRA